jgi:hypothetical protein
MLLAVTLGIRFLLNRFRVIPWTTRQRLVFGRGDEGLHVFVLALQTSEPDHLDQVSVIDAAGIESSARNSS